MFNGGMAIGMVMTFDVLMSVGVGVATGVVLGTDLAVCGALFWWGLFRYMFF